MAMLKLAVVLAGTASESMSDTVKFTVPAATGVPDIVPLVLSFSPAGNVPELMLQT